jgi:hypothetical protein
MSRTVIVTLIYHRHKPIDLSLIEFYEYFTSELKLIAVLLSSLLFFIKMYTQIHASWPSGGRTVVIVLQKYQDHTSPLCAAILTEVSLGFLSLSRQIPGLYLVIDNCFLPRCLEYTTR